MTDSLNHKKIKFIINIAYIFAVFLLIYVFFKYLFGLLFPFIAAFIICCIAEPTVQVLCKELKLKRHICSAICIVIIIVLLCCIVCLISLTLYSQLKLLFASLPDLINNITEYIDGLQAKNTQSFIEKALIAAEEYILSVDLSLMTESGIIENIFSYFTKIFTSLPQFLMTGIVTLAFSIFLSSSFPKVKRFIIRQVPKKSIQLLLQIKSSAFSILKNYLKSYTLLMLITFSELCLAFAIFDIRPVFALALIISLIDILPVFGVGTVMIPWGIVCFVTGNFTQGMIVWSIYAVITVIRQIIEPKIIGNSIGLPPVIALPAMFIGLKLFGIAGLFTAPMITMLVYDLHSKGYISIWK